MSTCEHLLHLHVLSEVVSDAVLISEVTDVVELVLKLMPDLLSVSV